MPTFIGAVGVAGLTAIVTARTRALVHATTETLATLGGLHTAFVVAAAVALAGAALAAPRVRGERRAPHPASRS